MNKFSMPMASQFIFLRRHTLWPMSAASSEKSATTYIQDVRRSALL